MFRRLFIFCVACGFFIVPIRAAGAYENSALILYHEARNDGSLSYEPHEDILASLLGHFDLPTRRKRIKYYKKGDIDKHRVTFYIGNVSRNKLPETFLLDVLRAKRRVVWINRNLARLAKSPKYKAKFETRFGFRYEGGLARNSYGLVKFKGQYFFRQQQWIGRARVLNKDKTEVLGRAVTNDFARAFPYMVKSGKFTYVSDNPMEGAWSEDSAYLAFADKLHTMLGIAHKNDHRALVRLEDITPNEDPAKVKAMGDFLYRSGVPFTMGVVPRYTDPRGVYGPAKTIDLDQAPRMVSTLKYLQQRGGTLIMHGVSHQYGNVPNPYTGTSIDDYEFYIDRLVNGVATEISPVPEDSTAWVEGRLNQGFAIFKRAGFSRPTIWETPHYGASNLDYRVFSKHFAALNERPHLGAYFPYLIRKSYYGGKVIPENLGYINSQTRPPHVVVALAKKNRVVRDGLASFYVHPRLIDPQELGAAISGIRSLGFRFVGIKSL